MWLLEFLHFRCMYMLNLTGASSCVTITQDYNFFFGGWCYFCDTFLLHYTQWSCFTIFTLCTSGKQVISVVDHWYVIEATMLWGCNFLLLLTTSVHIGSLFEFVVVWACRLLIMVEIKLISVNIASFTEQLFTTFKTLFSSSISSCKFSNSWNVELSWVFWKLFLMTFSTVKWPLQWKQSRFIGTAEGCLLSNTILSHECPNFAGLDSRSFERQVFVEFILSAVW